MEMVGIEEAGNSGSVSDVGDVSSDVAVVADAAWKALFIASNC